MARSQEDIDRIAEFCHCSVDIALLMSVPVKIPKDRAGQEKLLAQVRLAKVRALRSIICASADLFAVETKVHHRRVRTPSERRLAARFVLGTCRGGALRSAHPRSPPETTSAESKNIRGAAKEQSSAGK